MIQLQHYSVPKGIVEPRIAVNTTHLEKLGGGDRDELF